MCRGSKVFSSFVAVIKSPEGDNSKIDTLLKVLTAIKDNIGQTKARCQHTNAQALYCVISPLAFCIPAQLLQVQDVNGQNTSAHKYVLRSTLHLVLICHRS